VDIDRKLDDRKGIFNKLLNMIPGYTGYSRREARREADKKLRDDIANELNLARQKIDALIGDLSAAGQIMMLSDVGRLLKRIERVADLIRYAPHGESAFMALDTIGEEQLETLYFYDYELKEKAAAIAGDVAALQAADPSALKTAIKDIMEKLDNLDQLINGRKKHITEEF